MLAFFSQQVCGLPGLRSQRREMLDRLGENSTRLLQLIYELSGGDADEIIQRKHLGKPLGISERETRRALKTLTREGAIRYILFNSLCITHVGIAAAKRLGEPGAPPTSTPEEQARLTRLREILDARFDREELRTLCFDLGLNYDDLPGEGRAAKARELVARMHQLNRIADLIKVGARMRSDVAWEPLEPPPDPPGEDG
jgi:hypothetical protein